MPLLFSLPLSPGGPPLERTPLCKAFYKQSKNASGQKAELCRKPERAVNSNNLHWDEADPKSKAS